MAIPINLDMKVADLKEPIFAGAENATLNFKIIVQADPVFRNLYIFTTFTFTFYVKILQANPLLKALSVGIFVLIIFSYFATIVCYQRIKAFLKANMLEDVVRGMKRKTLNKIIRSMLIQVGSKIIIINVV
jgi:hypothetical protein